MYGLVGLAVTVYVLGIGGGVAVEPTRIVVPSLNSTDALGAFAKSAVTHTCTVLPEQAVERLVVRLLIVVQKKVNDAVFIVKGSTSAPIQLAGFTKSE